MLRCLLLLRAELDRRNLLLPLGLDFRKRGLRQQWQLVAVAAIAAAAVDAVASVVSAVGAACAPASAGSGPAVQWPEVRNGGRSKSSNAARKPFRC